MDETIKVTGLSKSYAGNKVKYSSDRDTQRADCKSAVFHADFFLFRLLGCGSSMGSAASA